MTSLRHIPGESGPLVVWSHSISFLFPSFCWYFRTRPFYLSSLCPPGARDSPEGVLSTEVTKTTHSVMTDRKTERDFSSCPSLFCSVIPRVLIFPVLIFPVVSTFGLHEWRRVKLTSTERFFLLLFLFLSSQPKVSVGSVSSHLKGCVSFLCVWVVWRKTTANASYLSILLSLLCVT